MKWALREIIAEHDRVKALAEEISTIREDLADKLGRLIVEYNRER